MNTINIPNKKVVILKIEKIFEFFNPEYFNIFISLLSNKLLKKTCVEIKNINGNISNTNIEEFKMLPFHQPKSECVRIPSLSKRIHNDKSPKYRTISLDNFMMPKLEEYNIIIEN